MLGARSCKKVGALQGGGGSSPVEPGSMLWLIQRDFLEGKTVQAMVSEALQPVANPYQDQDIAQVHTALLLFMLSAGTSAYGHGDKYECLSGVVLSVM